MKNGIYIENFMIWNNCKVSYKNNLKFYIETNSGTKIWTNNDKLHRLDGPAIEFYDGDKWWYLDDKFIDVKTQKEFERYMIKKIFE